MAPVADGMTAIAADETFCFACHPGVPCFTECCRMLELALHPYDFVLLRRATGLDSPRLFARYIIEEDGPSFPLPRHYLAMVDDGRASCPFVGEKGCQIYPFRPAACRSYPIGRAVLFQGNAVEERFVLVRETHCRGFEHGAFYRPAAYLAAQDLGAINRCHDAVARLVQHPEMKHFTPGAEQKRLYVLALCQTDLFRARLRAGDFVDFAVDASQSDEDLLIRAATWLGRKFFPSSERQPSC
jgi:Fe-S-cluster containining protein